jgi:hydroxymethylbilane synthase
MSKLPLRIGTRASPLALAQAEETKARLIAHHPSLAAAGAIQIIAMKTSGDLIQDRSLLEAGGKGLFTKEIEQALLAGDIDLAVHSMKDVPTHLPQGLVIECFLPREDVRDAFFSRDNIALKDLPLGAVIGTSGLRRQAQLLALRPDLQIIPLRGNVGTRLKKLADGVVMATLLAKAGLNRLHYTGTITALLSPDEMLPAVAQGAIGLQSRSEDARVLPYLAPLNCRRTALCVGVERSFLAALDGSCRTPIAALAQWRGDEPSLRLQTLIARPNGLDLQRQDLQLPVQEAHKIASALGTKLRQSLPEDFFSLLPQTLPPP